MRKETDFKRNGLDALLINPIKVEKHPKLAQNVAATAKGNPKETGNGEFDEAKFNDQQLRRMARNGSAAHIYDTTYSGNSGTGNEKATGEKSILNLFRANAESYGPSFMENLFRMIGLNNIQTSGAPIDIKDPIDVAYASFRIANKDDQNTTAIFERNLNLSLPNIAYNNRKDDFKPPVFKLDKNAARAELAADIDTVSNRYAAEAGMSPKDFALVMGGIAVIESRFGVSRSVTGTKHESSAGGAFHYLNGTIAGKVNQNLGDPRIAALVDELGVNVRDGVSKREAWILKEDNVLAGSILAKDIVKIAQRHPELRNDPEALATRVYQSHNMGEAGAKALAMGGVDALNKLDSRIVENNPMFFRKGDAQQNYQNFVGAAVDAAEGLFNKINQNRNNTVVASLKAPEPS